MNLQKAVRSGGFYSKLGSKQKKIASNFLIICPPS
jgi:hypothetical protein